jgi:hypothetical protein
MEYLQYIPAPMPILDGFHKQVKNIVGLSPNGVDPMVRFEWAMDITERWGEKLVQRYPDDNEPPKYVGLPYFIMEGWQNPEVYDREEWEQNKDVMGDFPENGVWDFIAVVRDEQFNYLPLGSRALQMARENRFWRSKGNKRAIAELKERRAKLQGLKDQRFAAAKKEILDNFVKEFSDAERNNPNAQFSFATNIKGAGYKTTNSGLIIPN